MRQKGGNDEMTSRLECEFGNAKGSERPFLVGNIGHACGCSLHTHIDIHTLCYSRQDQARYEQHRARGCYNTIRLVLVLVPCICACAGAFAGAGACWCLCLCLAALG